MYSGAVVKVCADSQQKNKKTNVLHFKTTDFAKLCQKSIFSPQGVLVIFRQKRNHLEPNKSCSVHKNHSIIAI